MSSIWNIELGVIAGGDETRYKRAEGIIDALRQSGREVEGAGPTWRATYVDFEDEPAALEALAAELDAIDRDWSEVLTIG